MKKYYEFGTEQAEVLEKQIGLFDSELLRDRKDFGPVLESKNQYI